MRLLNKESQQELFCLQTQIDCQAFSIFGFGSCAFLFTLLKCVRVLVGVLILTLTLTVYVRVVFPNLKLLGVYLSDANA